MNRKPISITPSFMDAFSRLGKSDQKRVSSTMSKLIHDHKVPSLRNHSIESKRGDYISFSANMDLRLIGHKYNEFIVLIYVDHHDAAYEWCQNHMVVHDEEGSFFEILPSTNGDGIGSVPNALIESTVDPRYGIEIANRLDDFNLPTEFVKQIRMLESEGALLDLLVDVSPWIQELVLCAVTGDKSPMDYRQSPYIAVLSSDVDLELALHYPLEKWRLFLHPSQKDFVKGHYFQKKVLIGGPGTGKTIALVHRAAYLNSLGKRVLFITKSSEMACQIQSLLSTLQGEVLVDVGFLVHSEARKYSVRIKLEKNRAVKIGGAPPFAVQLVDGLVSRDVNVSYEHILVDESQDLQGPEQRWIADLIQIQEMGLSIALDRNQGVFTSNLHELLDALEQGFSDGKTDKVGLFYSYRLTKEIAEYARELRDRAHTVRERGITYNTLNHRRIRERLSFLEARDEVARYYGLSGAPPKWIACEQEELFPTLIDEIQNKAMMYDRSSIAVLVPKKESISDLAAQQIYVDKRTYLESKGLEWLCGIVIVDQIWFSALESGRLLAKPSNIKRINAFYVATTRFRESLTVIVVSSADSKWSTHIY